MNAKLAAAVAIVLSLGVPCSAHRLDEYLQATLISIEKDRVQAQIRLIPGVAVFPVVLASIDTDADGIISDAEQRAYVRRVLRDLSLAIDGESLTVRLQSARFPQIQEMKEGRGEIQIDVDANLPRGGPSRKLTFQNHHLNGIAAYLVNCLVPPDPDIKVIAQNRNYPQSFYELQYMQVHSWSRDGGWLGLVALFLLARLALLLWRHRAELRPRESVN